MIMATTGGYVTHKVKKGETLMSIAKLYKSKYFSGMTDTKARNTLAANNDITSPYRIHIGQVLVIAPTGSGKKVKKKNNSLTPKITAFGIQSDSEDTVFATWAFDRAHVSEYKCMWYYSTGDDVWFVGSDSTEKYKQSTYNPPSNAKSVRFKVKAISKKHKVTTTTKVKQKNGKYKTQKKTKEVAYWTGKWSSTKTCNFIVSQEPATPSAPTVEIKNYKLTASLENIATGINAATQIEFRVVKNNVTNKSFAINTVDIKNRSAAHTWNVTAGNSYKVQCQAIRKINGTTLRSDYSDYSSEVKTVPPTPSNITSLKATSSTEITIKWTSVSNATSYEVQYTTDKLYFDTNPDNVSTKTIENGTTAIISGIDKGDEYFFRVRAKNDQGNSGWTSIKSCKVGQKPAAPTTWSSTTVAIVGEPVIFYWVHNSNDESKATKSYIEIVSGNITIANFEIKHNNNDDEKEPTYQFEISTDPLTDGGKIQWRVKTAGVTGEYGDWSVQRTVDVYAPPTLEFALADKDDNDINTLTAFPAYIVGYAGPDTQTAIGFHVTITSLDSYETEDEVGNEILVSANEEIFSKYYDINRNTLIVELSPANISLESGIHYRIEITVSMNSGLTASHTYDFDVEWDEIEYGPDADIIYNEDTMSVSIRPYCYTTPDQEYPDDESEINPDSVDDPVDEILVENVKLSVYRRDYNGEFIEIGKDLENSANTYITDPHPALDYGRYRIVVTDNTTGRISYADLPPYPIDESSVVIQWDETWEHLETSQDNEDEIPDTPTWNGSKVVLPYNIDVSDKNNIDVELVKYIGRKRPVSYYGTQLGETASWKVEIPKSDVDTLYDLRRLAIWTGDVYVREPSGSGYWANIAVSFSQTHCETTIPVNIEITRVEGGV